MAQNKPGRDRLNRFQRDAKERAERCGIYLLFEDAGKSEKWVFYDVKTGVSLGTWCPGSQRGGFGGAFGPMTLDEAFDAAGARTKPDPCRY